MESFEEAIARIFREAGVDNGQLQGHVINTAKRYFESPAEAPVAKKGKK